MSQQGTSGYYPGRRLKTTGGITQPLFESRSYDKAIPVELGFIRNGDASNNAIIVVNYSGRDLAVVLDGNREMNPQYGNTRYNEREKGGVVVPDGRSSHFPVHPSCYHVSIGEYQTGVEGATYFLTSLATTLESLNNTAITVVAGSNTGDLRVKVNPHIDQAQYFTLQNNSGRSIYVRITKEATAYQPTLNQISMEKASRNPDQGPKIEEQKKVESGFKLVYKSPPVLWNVRGLDVERQSAARSADSSMEVVPLVTNYVEGSETQASSGQVVVFFADSKRNGGIIAVPYDADELKFVNPTLATILPRDM